MTRLPEGWHEVTGRIARISASRFRGGSCFTWAERVDLALGGIIEAIAEGGGWPDGEKPLFRAADNAIRREEREITKHQMRGSYWVDVRGGADELAEAITDRVAVWQVIWAFTDGQWAAVWAMAEVKKRGGGWHEAAALLGANPATFSVQLALARKRARALWVAPGDTAPGLWAQDPKGPADRRPTSQLRRRMTERARRAA